MSKRSNARLSLATTVLTQLRRTSITYKLGQLSKRDSDLAQISISLLLCMLYDSLLTTSHLDSSTSLILRLANDVSKSGIDIFNCIETLTKYDMDLITEGVIKLHRCQDDEPFARRVVGGLVAHKVPLWPTCHQVLSFLKRLNLTDVDGLERDTLTAYYGNLYRVEVYNASGCPTTEERAIIHQWLSSYRPPEIDDCQFGSGATSDKSIKSVGEKYHNLYDTERTYYFCKRNNIPPAVYTWKGRTQSRVKCVPKSYKTYRPIAMEPPQVMFYQQGVMKSLDRIFMTTLARRISLHDQQRSRNLAQIGSITGHLATIDLSSASDSVSMRLFRQWFSGTRAFVDLMLLRSSTAITPDGEIELPQYASMGSALCFPIECIVFAAMCEATIREAGVDPCTSEYCVYGDDIIIESEFAEALIERLERNGFIVNKEKSFITGPFRESCGGEYLHGLPVNPVRIPRKLSSDLTSPNSFTALISLANACFARNLMTTRLLIIHLLGNKKLLPWTDDLRALDEEYLEGDKSVDLSPSSSGLYTPGHVFVEKLWSDDWQRSVTLRLAVVSHSTADLDDEVGRHDCVLHQPESAQLDEKLATPRCVGRSRPVVDLVID